MAVDPALNHDRSLLLSQEKETVVTGRVNSKLRFLPLRIELDSKAFPSAKIVVDFDRLPTQEVSAISSQERQLVIPESFNSRVTEQYSIRFRVYFYQPFRGRLTASFFRRPAEVSRDEDQEELPPRNYYDQFIPQFKLSPRKTTDYSLGSSPRSSPRGSQFISKSKIELNIDQCICFTKKKIELKAKLGSERIQKEQQSHESRRIVLEVAKKEKLIASMNKLVERRREVATADSSERLRSALQWRPCFRGSKQSFG